ncbi:MBL fold metallo-hydrolase [Paenibacillus physcomitrellae]|uniref:Metallo-beta-lactamase domain-containing protein n=1 Tax=Paenibacillus physcomitrellae TaxID=1619311 RepID=A0ABQ1FT09_9BACL|nr:MBL fold metallo-hydrolase [Paenibacillus physcomitrellae]GGA28236.1 hypothetical protein GCM10010917_11500 [Paenibacillus physcomitrellae]
MKIQLVRHATLWIEYGGTTFLVDPMFSETGANPPIPNTENGRRNPLIPLPGPAAQWTAPDVMIVTHLHRDHWDQAAAEALPKSTPVLCQPGDRQTFAEAGFRNVTEIQEHLDFGGILIHRTGGRHGTGEIGRAMGPVSGFVFQAEHEPSLYVAGDTIWCDEVKAALDAFKPQAVVVNAGGARFLEGDPITMTDMDIAKLARYAPYTHITAVHMDSINHCLLTRDLLKIRLSNENLLDRVAIPNDGEWVENA